MRVELSSIGKRYAREWILRDIDLLIQSGQHLAILGSNGSGKSTLLKIISGYLTPSKGTLSYSHEDKSVEQSQVYRHLGFVAPYQDIYSKMTVKEIVAFHFSLRQWRAGSSEELLFDLLKLPLDEAIHTFSSGMVQRVKLGLALHTQSSLLLFDEPTMNLDEHATAWFINQLEQLPKEITVILASNLPGSETSTCTKKVSISSGRLED